MKNETKDIIHAKRHIAWLYKRVAIVQDNDAVIQGDVFSRTIIDHCRRH
jgi:hypothetical protein